MLDTPIKNGNLSKANMGLWEGHAHFKNNHC